MGVNSAKFSLSRLGSERKVERRAENEKTREICGGGKLVCTEAGSSLLLLEKNSRRCHGALRAIDGEEV